MGVWILVATIPDLNVQSLPQGKPAVQRMAEQLKDEQVTEVQEPVGHLSSKHWVAAPGMRKNTLCFYAGCPTPTSPGQTEFNPGRSS